MRGPRPRPAPTRAARGARPSASGHVRHVARPCPSRRQPMSVTSPDHVRHVGHLRRESTSPGPRPRPDPRRASASETNGREAAAIRPMTMERGGCPARAGRGPPRRARSRARRAKRPPFAGAACEGTSFRGRGEPRGLLSRAGGSSRRTHARTATEPRRRARRRIAPRPHEAPRPWRGESEPPDTARPCTLHAHAHCTTMHTARPCTLHAHAGQCTRESAPSLGHALQRPPPLCNARRRSTPDGSPPARGAS